MSVAETRAQALLGTRSTRRIEGKTRRTLAKAKALFERVAADWSEVDGVMTEEMDGLRATIDTILDPGGILDGCIEQLHEPWGQE